MSIILKLEHEADTLDLMTGRYCVDDATFSPPTAARAVTFGQATIGADVTAKRRENRSWQFNVTITGSSPQEAERGLRELQTFLNRAGQANPLYIAYRSWNDYTYEPFFGLHGAFMRYEVVHAAAEAGRAYKNALKKSNTIVNVQLAFIIKPQSVGIEQHAGQATGGIFEDFIGKANGLSRGTVIAEATTNKMTNPIFMNATYNTGWGVSNAIVSANKDTNFILFGDTSARVYQTAANGEFRQSINVGNTNAHVLSFYAKREDGGVIDSIKAHYGTAKTTNYVSVGDGWYYCWASVTGVAAGTETGISFSAILGADPTGIYVDGFQIEEKAYPTPLCHGDLLACTWSGAKNATTSSRTAGTLVYDYDKLLNINVGFTMRVVWFPLTADLQTDRYLFNDSDRDLRLWIDSSEQYNAGTVTASTIQSAAVTLTPGTPEVLHLSYDGATLILYQNGVSLKSGSATFNTTQPASLYVGSSDSGGNQLNAPMMGLASTRRVMSAAEVLVDYNALTQQATDSDRIDPLPWFWTDGGDGVLDNDNDGTEANYAIVGGLMGDDADAVYQIDSDSDFVTRVGVTWGSLAVDQRDFDKDILTDGGTNTLLFEDGTGTVDTDANGDAVMQLAPLATTALDGPSTAVTKVNANILRNARSVVGYFVASDANTFETVQCQLVINYSADINDAQLSRWKTISTDTVLRPYITHEMPISFERDILDGQQQIGFELRFQRTSGSDNFDISHAIFFINYSAMYYGGGGATGTPDHLYARGRTGYIAITGDTTALKARRTFNRPLIITPERLNVLMFQHTYRHNSNVTATWTSSADAAASVDVEQFAVTPRFDIF